MASVHITEIMRYLQEKGYPDAIPLDGATEGFLLEIKFDDPNRSQSHPIDTELSNKVLTVDTAWGIATILFDKEGLLKSIEIS